MSDRLIVQVPTERDLSWMAMVCRPWAGPGDSRFADQWAPITFDAPQPWLTLDGRVIEKVPAVAALSDPVAILAIGQYKSVVPPLAMLPEVLATNRAWAAHYWALPEPPCEMLHGVSFERFRRWLADQQPHSLARLVGAVIDKRDLAPIFDHLYDEPLTIARPVLAVRPRDHEVPLHIHGETWRVIYQPVDDRKITALAKELPEWRNG